MRLMTNTKKKLMIPPSTSLRWGYKGPSILHPCKGVPSCNSQESCYIRQLAGEGGRGERESVSDNVKRENPDPFPWFLPFFFLNFFTVLVRFYFGHFLCADRPSGQKQVISSFVFVEGALLPFCVSRFHRRSYELIEHEMSNNNID